MSFFKRFRPGLLSIAVLSRFKTENNVFDKVKDDDDDDNDGWKRVKKMYSYSNGRFSSPQFASIIEAGFTGFLFGGVIGSINDSKETFYKFIEQNKTTMYKHQYEAKRALQDEMILSIMKGGWRVGWRIGLVTSSLVAVVLTLHMYRGHSSIPEFTISGAVTCGLYKLKDGPKPGLGGAFFGGIYGTMMGVIIVGLMKITGITLDDLFAYDQDKIDKYNERVYEYMVDKRQENFPDVKYRREGFSTSDLEGEETKSSEVEETKSKVNNSVAPSSN